MSLITGIVLTAAAVLLFVAALLGVNRIAAGPSQLERSIAADLIVAVVVAALGLWIVTTDVTTEMLILVLLSMLGFSGAVVVARMVGHRQAIRQRYIETQDEEG